jgi:hypothetical protein
MEKTRGILIQVETGHRLVWRKREEFSIQVENRLLWRKREENEGRSIQVGFYIVRPVWSCRSDVAAFQELAADTRTIVR